MIKINIGGETYTLKNKLEDLTLREMCSYMNACKMFEKREIKMADGSVEYETVKADDWSYDFTLDRNAAILSAISDIPREYLDVIGYELLQRLEISSGEFDEFDAENEMTLSINGATFVCPVITEWTFQQWCDFENMFNDDYMMFFGICFTRRGKSYDRLHQELATKTELLGSLPASKAIGALYAFVDIVHIIRSNYQFVYSSQTVGEPAGKNVSLHCERFKWEDTIINLANNAAPVFNHPNGTLYGVRNARAIDVLDYLNIKRSRDDAEYLDWKSKNKSLNKH